MAVGTTAALIGAGSMLGSALLGRGGRSQQSNMFAPPVYPQLQQQWGNFLGGQIGQGVSPYPGQLNANVSPWIGQAGAGLQNWMNQPTIDTSGIANRFMQQPSVGAGQFVREMLPEGGSGAFQNLRGDIVNAANASQGEDWRQAIQGPQGFLTDIAKTGLPINQMDSWNAMVAAQERNLQQRGAQVGERTAGPGGRFSSSYGQAQADYYSQAAKDQNALLAEMTRQAGESAAGRQLGASQALLQVPELYRAGYGQQLQGLLGAGQLQAGQEGRDIDRTRAMMQGWGLDISKGQAGADIALRQQMLGPAGFNQAMQLGQYQTGLEQGNLGREQANWMMSQPWANPYLQYINQASQLYPRPTGLPPQPSPWQNVIQTAGSIAGQLPWGDWFGGGGGGVPYSGFDPWAMGGGPGAPSIPYYQYPGQ